MKSYRKELFSNIPTRRDIVNITAQVGACLGESGIREGLCLVNTTISPAAVTDQLPTGSHFRLVARSNRMYGKNLGCG